MGSSGIRAGATGTAITTQVGIDFLDPLWAGPGLEETVASTIAALNDLPLVAGFPAHCARVRGGVPGVAPGLWKGGRPAGGRPAPTIDPAGHRTTFTRDGAGRLTQIDSHDAGTLRPEQVSLGKLNNVRESIAIARECRTLLGANGITLDYPVLRHANNLESVLTYEGTSEVHQLVIGQALTGQAAFR